MRNKLKTMYLDYFNNFLSIAAFSEYYGIDHTRGMKIISLGRRLNHRR